MKGYRVSKCKSLTRNSDRISSQKFETGDVCPTMHSIISAISEQVQTRSVCEHVKLFDSAIY